MNRFKARLQTVKQCQHLEIAKIKNLNTKQRPEKQNHPFSMELPAMPTRSCPLTAYESRIWVGFGSPACRPIPDTQLTCRFPGVWRPANQNGHATWLPRVATRQTRRFFGQNTAVARKPQHCKLLISLREPLSSGLGLGLCKFCF